MPLFKSHDAAVGGWNVRTGELNQKHPVIIHSIFDGGGSARVPRATQHRNAALCVNLARIYDTRSREECFLTSTFCHDPSQLRSLLKARKSASSSNKFDGLRPLVHDPFGEQF